VLLVVVNGLIVKAAWRMPDVMSFCSKGYLRASGSR
jgi:hypothetical protein